MYTRRKNEEIQSVGSLHSSLQYGRRSGKSETAIEIANDEFGGLTNYAGMGSCDCLVGVFTSDDERCVFPDSDPEFDDCEEICQKKDEKNG